MNEERLNQLLKRADQAMPAPPHVAGLAGKVVARRRRQQVTRRITASAAAVAVVAVGLTLAALKVGSPAAPVAERPMPAPVDQSAAQVAILTAQAKELGRQADEALWAAKQLIQSSKTRQLEGQLAAMGPLSVDQRRQEASAKALLAEAYMLDEARQDRRQVASLYTQVVQLYPETSWARFARQRLTEIQR